MNVHGKTVTVVFPSSSKYLELADIALGLKKPESPFKKRKVLTRTISSPDHSAAEGMSIHRTLIPLIRLKPKYASDNLKVRCRAAKVSLRSIAPCP